MYWLDALWKVANQGFSIRRICSISVVNQTPKLNLLPISVHSCCQNVNLALELVMYILPMACASHGPPLA